ncbi:MAG: pilin [Patescibacteria group bacterium]|jgi:hypothetical protein
MHRHLKHGFAIKFFALAVLIFGGFLSMSHVALATGEPCWQDYPAKGTPIAGFPNATDFTLPGKCQDASGCALAGFVVGPSGFGCGGSDICCLTPAKTLGCYNDYVGADRTTFTSASCVKNDAACSSPNKKLGNGHGCSAGVGGDVCCAIVGATGAAKTDANGYPVGAAIPDAGSTAQWKFNNDSGTGIQLVACTEDGNCSVDDIVNQGINFAKWVMGLAGALFLLVFVYGGAMYVISFGKSDYVTKGKNALIRGSIGIVLVMSAWTIVSYVAASLGYVPVGTGSTADADAACAKQHTGYSCMNVSPEQEKSQYICYSSLCKSNKDKQYKCCIQAPTNK